MAGGNQCGEPPGFVQHSPPVCIFSVTVFWTWDTKWGIIAGLTPLVVVPKGDGDLRLCVDMRRAIDENIRERHPIPTVEELLHDSNGSTVFSKIDLKWGFHQILLCEKS